MKGAQTIRIAHVITALEVGGAELKLYRLLKYFQGSNIENVVISLAVIKRPGCMNQLQFAEYMLIPCWSWGIQFHSDRIIQSPSKFKTF